MAAAPETIHATAIAVAGRAVLIRGPSGSGKSDLALRCLINAPSPLLPDPVELVADDHVILARAGTHLVARSPETISGFLEVRGQGLYRLPFTAQAKVVLVADLVQPVNIERLPENPMVMDLCGVKVAHIQLAAFENSAVSKLLLALSPQHHRIEVE